MKWCIEEACRVREKIGDRGRRKTCRRKDGWS
jgi:hypothetical protein